MLEPLGKIWLQKKIARGMEWSDTAPRIQEKDIENNALFREALLNVGYKNFSTPIKNKSTRK